MGPLASEHSDAGSKLKPVKTRRPFFGPIHFVDKDT